MITTWIIAMRRWEKEPHYGRACTFRPKQMLLKATRTLAGTPRLGISCVESRLTLSPTFGIRILANYAPHLFYAEFCFFVRRRNQSHPSPLHYLWSSALLILGGQKVFRPHWKQRKTYLFQPIPPLLMGSRSGLIPHHLTLCYCIERSGPRLVCWRQGAGSF